MLNMALCLKVLEACLLYKEFHTRSLPDFCVPKINTKYFNTKILMSSNLELSSVGNKYSNFI